MDKVQKLMTGGKCMTECKLKKKKKIRVGAEIKDFITVGPKSQRVCDAIDQQRPATAPIQD